MGKQTRRKNRNTKKNNGRDCAVNRNKSEIVTNGSGSSALVNRIRHGDIRIRHGALTALSSTLFSPESLSRRKHPPKKNKMKNKKEKITLDLIQAMSERILDDDIPCALCATGCLANYVLFGMDTDLCSDSNGNDDSRAARIIAPILLAKIDKASDKVGTLANRIVVARASLSQSITGSSLSRTNNPTLKGDAPSLSSEASHTKKSGKKIKDPPATPSAVSLKELSKLNMMITEQWSLLSLCLHALCGLIESFSSPTNGLHAIDSHDNDLLTILNQEDIFLNTLLRILAMGSEMLVTNLIISPSDTTFKDNQQDPNEVLEDCIIYSARTLHASLDENPKLAHTLLSSSISSPTSKSAIVNDSATTDSNHRGMVWNTVQSYMENTHLPALARLHCAGILIASRHLIVSSSKTRSTTKTSLNTINQEQLETVITTKALPLLNQYLVYHTPIADALMNQIAVTQNEQIEEKMDEQMEKDVIRKVEQRKESARLIARRQKEMKKRIDGGSRASNPTAHQNDKADNMAVDNSKGGEKSNSSATTVALEENAAMADKSSNEVDATDKYEKAITAWKKACLPLKLAVEISTNLTVGSQFFDLHHHCKYNDDADVDMEWGSDQEEELLSKVTCMNNQEMVVNDDSDAVLFRHVISSGISDRILSLLGTILLTIIENSRVTNIKLRRDNETAATPATVIPELVMDDLTEILSKCGACLGNLLSNIPSWKEDDEDTYSTWKELCQALSAIALNGSINITSVDVKGTEKGLSTDIGRTARLSIMAPLCNVMSSFLRFRPTLAAHVNETELNLILSCVLLPPMQSQENSDNGNDVGELITSISDVKRDAVAMLGVLCSKPHSSEVNDQICSILLSALLEDSGVADASLRLGRNSNRDSSIGTALMSEILNVLMDMYSADEDDPNSHSAVFNARDVLGGFQKSVPVLRRKIRQEEEERGALTAASFDDIEIWKETVLNATRFIRYKEGQH